MQAITRVLLCLTVLPLYAQTQLSNATMTVEVKVPANTPANDTIWIFPGQMFNVFSRHVPMSRVSGTSDTWRATVSAPAGTILHYFFHRNDDWNKQELYAPLGSKGYAIDVNLYQQQPPLRQVLVINGATVRETVAQWSDTQPVDNTTGTLTGTVADQAGKPLAGIWISAGPHQTMTDASGVFQIYGVPAGPCTITARSENGEFAATNAAVTVSPNATTVQNLGLKAATMSSVTFTVTVPANTPEGAVPRLFGDTYRLGMVAIAGQPEPETTRYIELTSASGGKWTYTTQLGNGTCVNYLYTLGHRILNFENDTQSNLVSRSVCVNGTTAVSDTVTSWKSPLMVPVTLTATSHTGTEDTLYVTADGDNGGMLVKMWPTGPGKATYTLYVSPNTTLKYRYVRNGDPDIGLEIVGTDSNPPAYRSLAVGPNGAARNDTIHVWRHQMREPALTTVTSSMNGPVVARAAPFQTGVELVDYWRSRWLPLVEPTLARIKSINAKWVTLDAIWAFVVTEPPKGELIYNSFPPQDLIAHIRAAKEAAG